MKTRNLGTLEEGMKMVGRRMSQKNLKPGKEVKEGSGKQEKGRVISLISLERIELTGETKVHMPGSNFGRIVFLAGKEGKKDIISFPLDAKGFFQGYFLAMAVIPENKDKETIEKGKPEKKQGIIEIMDKGRKEELQEQQKGREEMGNGKKKIGKERNERKRKDLPGRIFP